MSGGTAVARNLVSADMEIRVWNRTREKAEPLADDGAEVADRTVEAAEGADFLLTMLSDTDATAEAVGGGALAALSADAVWAAGALGLLRRSPNATAQPCKPVTEKRTWPPSTRRSERKVGEAA